MRAQRVPGRAWHEVGASADLGPIPRACVVEDVSVQVWRTTTGEIVALAERPSAAFTRQQWPKSFLAREFGASVYLWLDHREPESA